MTLFDLTIIFFFASLLFKAAEISTISNVAKHFHATGAHLRLLIVSVFPNRLFSEKLSEQRKKF